MALPVILAFMARMAAKHGGGKAIQMAVKKFGKNAVQKATNKMTYVGKNVAKKTVKKKVKPKAKAKTKSINPYTLADYKQGIKYPRKAFKRKP
tara:strand:- start:497 stop:775 length:279 start_codon:yes stop_codon:yes gene_type:complete